MKRVESQISKLDKIAYSLYEKKMYKFDTYSLIVHIEWFVFMKKDYTNYYIQAENILRKLKLKKLNKINENRR